MGQDERKTRRSFHLGLEISLKFMNRTRLTCASLARWSLSFARYEEAARYSHRRGWTRKREKGRGGERERERSGGKRKATKTEQGNEVESDVSDYE